MQKKTVSKKLSGIDIRRRHILLAVGSSLGVFVSGCVGDTSDPATGTSTPTAETPMYDCNDATRPASPEPDADPPGDTERYMYPTRPDSLSDEQIRSYVKRYERAYRLNKVHSKHGSKLNHASVSIGDTAPYDAPNGAAIGQVKYAYDAEVEGDDGPIEIDSPTLYASYYVDDDVVLRAVDKELQEDVSRLVADPLEQGQPVECF